MILDQHDIDVFIGSEVWKSDHHRCGGALDRAGRTLFDRLTQMTRTVSGNSLGGADRIDGPDSSGSAPCPLLHARINPFSQR